MAKNFIIVGTQRTGSSAFAEMIGFHPRIACGWEWTNIVPWWKKIAVAKKALNGEFDDLPSDEMRHMKSICNENSEWIGYRRLFRSSDKWIGDPRYSPALWLDRFEEHLNWIAHTPDLHIIHLIRMDNIAWLKSKFLSKVTKTYVGKKYPDNVSVRIPIREAIARIRSKMWVDCKLSNLEESNPYMAVNYEDFLANKVGVVSDALKFLGCDPDLIRDKADSGRKRQSKGDVSRAIENYEQLHRKLDEQGLLFFNMERDCSR